MSWFLFYSFLPFALYALVLSFYSLNYIHAEREISKSEYNAGEALKVTLKLKRAKAFPLLYLIVEDCLSEQLLFSKQKNKAKIFLFPGFRKEILLEYEISDLPRGEHIFQGIRIKTGDLLGLIEKEKQMKAENRIIVYPAYEEMNYRPLENHYDQGMTASKERVQRETSMAVGIREYQPGDRFSWINWKATARRNDIMTKEFEQRQSHDVYILMDCISDSRFEAMVSFTASMARAILRTGAQVGFLSSASERAAFPVKGGEGQKQLIFYHLAKVKDDSPVTIDQVLEAEKFLSQQNVNLMLITAQLTKPLVEKAGAFASRKGSAMIFLMKEENESPSKEELSLKGLANTRGLRVVMVHDGHFSDVFSEVVRG